MRGINKVILLGRATRDTDLRSTGSGTPVSNIRLATNRITRGKDGELTEHPQYHTVICWERLAEQTGKHVTKGRLIYVEGRLESRSFTDKDGKEREVTEVIASDVQFLDGPGLKSTDLPAEERSADTDFDDLDLPF
ncbi:MAG TPA: single-stranded DNA-binding protein [Chloroflexota bacterium]|nr:single-stranded DNA-binding protein [Chloroflexota bacterium]